MKMAFRMGMGSSTVEISSAVRVAVEGGHEYRKGAADHEPHRLGERQSRGGALNLLPFPRCVNEEGKGYVFNDYPRGP